MKIHREGYPTLILVLVILIILNCLTYFLSAKSTLGLLISLPISTIIFTFFLQFFRNPVRNSDSGPNEIICPADGEVVVIEETSENEYFNDKRIQVSIFMSPFNVHINWNPIAGSVKYTKYHPGKYLVAWHPKSSTENERSTIVVEDKSNRQILVRQIAGAVARRIVTYSKENTEVNKNEQLGFIKFGSRVDVFLPLGTEINVKLKDKVKGNLTVLAKFS
ncbi:MAG: phosphatidylserine decarboxylase family protein [Bacteroidales bacterium]